MKTIVIIPSYEPEEKLITLTGQLIAKDLEVVVVDDGSGENYLPIFNQLTGATVLTHPENKGKGEGLKTAYRYIKETYADEEVAIVTADSDGRTSESQGLSLKQLAEFMKELNVTTAYNLDGGGSSTMYFNGQIINKPTTNGRNIEEREVSDIVYL